MKLQLKRSVSLESGAPKAPEASQLAYGELAINYNAVAGPVIFTKDSSNNVVKILPKLDTLVVTDPSSTQTITGKLKSSATVDGDDAVTLATKGWILTKINAVDTDAVSLSATADQTLASKLIIDPPESGDTNNTAATKGYVDTATANLLDLTDTSTNSVAGVLSFAVGQTFPAAKVSGTLNNANSGNAATATKLATAVTIGGTSFDGSANIDIAELNGEAAAYYLNATNLNAGTVPLARLSDASTSAKGIVQLSNATDSNVQTTAATSKAVYDAYNLANAAVPKSGGVTLTGTVTFATDQVFPTTKIDAGELPTDVIVTNIKDDLIVNADINSSAAIAGSKIQAAGAAGANAGVVTLTNAIDSTSETVAASAKAVKLAAEFNAGSTISVQETAPGGASQGDIWWDSSNNAGSAYIYYTDTDSSQWVPLVPGAGSIDYTRTVLTDSSTTQVMIAKLRTLATESSDTNTTVTTKGYVDSATTNKMPLAGGTFDGNVEFATNQILKIGNTGAKDLNISNDGTHSYITNISDANTTLKLSNSTSGTGTIILAADASETSIKCVADAEVSLYWNDSERLKTTSGGIDVIGTAALDLLQVGTNNNIAPNSSGSGHIQILANGYTGYITCNDGGVYLGTNTSTGLGLALQTNETNRLSIDANGNIGINTDTPQTLLHLKSGTPIIRMQDTDKTDHWGEIKIDSWGMDFFIKGPGADEENYRWHHNNVKAMELSSGYLTVGSGANALANKHRFKGGIYFDDKAEFGAVGNSYASQEFIVEPSAGFFKHIYVGIMGPEGGNSSDQYVPTHNDHVANKYYVDDENYKAGLTIPSMASEVAGLAELTAAATGLHIKSNKRFLVGDPASNPSIECAVNGQIGIGRLSPSTSSGLRTEIQGDGKLYGDWEVTGEISKGSGSFKIDHPLVNKKDTHYLVHSFVEGPQADLIYRGLTTLVNGTVSINIDTVSGMTEGTFVALNGNVQCFTTNETGWTAIKGSVTGNELTIVAQDSECTDTISWMVVGERIDPHIIATKWTDESGKVIVEPAKPLEPQD